MHALNMTHRIPMYFSYFIVLWGMGIWWGYEFFFFLEEKKKVMNLLRCYIINVWK